MFTMPFSLIHFAHEKSLKRGKNCLYGNINGQLVTVTPTANAEVLISVHLHESSALTNERLKSIEFEKKSPVQIHDVEDDVCRFSIAHKTSESKQVKALERGINDITKAIEPYNKTTNQKDLILVNGIARPNTEDEINIRNRRHKEKNEMSVDYTSAGFITLILSVIIGYLLGFGMAIMISKLKAGLHMISRAFLYILIPGGIYLKRARKLDMLGRVIILISALLLMVLAEFVMIYYGTNSAGFDYSFNEALDMFSNLLRHSDQYRKEFLIGVVIVFGFNFFPALIKSRKYLKVEDGFLVDKNYFNRAKDLKRPNKWRTGILVASLFVGAFGLVRHITLGVEYEYIYKIHQWGWFFLAWLVSFIIYYYIVKIVPSLRKSVGSIDYKPVNKSVKIVEILVYSTALATWLLTLINYVNLSFDSVVSTQAGRISGLDYNSVSKEYFFDFQSKKYPPVFMSVNTKNQPYLIDNTQVKATIKRGFLGSPFITKMNFFEVNNFDSAIKYLKSEEELMSSSIETFVKYDKSDEFKQKIVEWEKQCTTNHDYSCRLTSYVYRYNNDTINQARHLRKGCVDANDPVSCYGYFFGEQFDEVSKKLALSKLREGCELDKADHCLYLAYSLRKVDHPMYHREIKELIKKGAELKK